MAATGLVSCAVAGGALLVAAPSYATFLSLYVALVLYVSVASTERARAAIGTHTPDNGRGRATRATPQRDRVIEQRGQGARRATTCATDRPAVILLFGAAGDSLGRGANPSPCAWRGRGEYAGRGA